MFWQKRSFGCVIYELVMFEKLFYKENEFLTMSEIVHIKSIPKLDDELLNTAFQR